MTLGRRLTLAGTVLAVLGLGGVAVSTQLAAGTAIQATQRGDRDALQGALAGLVEQYFTATFLAAQSTATSTPWHLDGRDTTPLEHVAVTSPLTSYGAALVSLTGKELARSTAALPATDDPGYLPLRADLLAGRAGLSDVMRVGGHDVVAFAVPVVRGGRSVAVLLTYADIQTWALQAYDQQLHVGDGAVPYVLDRRGVVAASGDASALGTRPGLPTPEHTTTVTWRGTATVVSAGEAGRGWHAVTTQDPAAWSGGVTSSRQHALTALAALLSAVVALLVWSFHRQQAAQRRLAEERLHDPLTGLAQRRVFELKLDAAFVRQRRSGATVALLYCDLDRFKQVNDTLGHSAGDRLLCAVAERLQAAAREEDLVCRLGGDEFAVLCEGIPAAGVERLIRRLYAAVEVPVVLGKVTVTPAVSIGGALTHRAGDAASLLHAADLAMYEVKSSDGRHRVVVTDLATSVPPQRSVVDPQSLRR
jgi:diguanylate cyclase (GGDEF)-like protein